MLYLDNSATTSVLPEVRDKMLLYLTEDYGNPSSKYYHLAINAKNAVENARQYVAKIISAKETEIIFTSGATESNNLILKGVADYYSSKGKHIITSKVEHKSVLDICKFLETKGFQITYLDVDTYGRVNEEHLINAIREDTILVSIIWGNNELGSLNNIEALSKICKEHGVFFHTDATQVVGKIKMDLQKLNGISFLSFSAHKLHGPKGIGAAFIRSNEFNELIPITPLLHGGGQENNLRSGTYAVHNIVGFGEAARIGLENLDKNIEQLIKLEEKLINNLLNNFGEKIAFNSDTENKIPGIINVRFKGLNNEILLKKLSPFVAASSGSACSSTKPSHVLQAIGLDLKEVRESVRFSLSPYTKIDELDIFLNL